MFALIIAPHPDDELLLAAPLIPQLQSIGWEIGVLYLSNGDNLTLDYPRRILESLKCCSKQGIKKENIYFLGYADGWFEGHHIYVSAPEALCFSTTKLSKTRGIGEHPEYCFLRHGEHRLFTRENWKDDIKNILLETLPELIVCSDMDSHIDHVATSLIFEEILGEILHAKTNTWHPIILKSFAYLGKWEGPDDYYSFSSTCEMVKVPNRFSDTLSNPYYNWNERVQFNVPENFLTKKIRENRMYDLASCHKSQALRWYVTRISNSDIVFWERRTDNLMFLANVSATSGDIKFLSDFKFIDISQLSLSGFPIRFMNYAWIPEKNDKLRQIHIKFDEAQLLSTFVFYCVTDSENYFEMIRLLLHSENEEFTEMLIPIALNQRKKVFHLPAEILVNEIQISIQFVHGIKFGFSEIEVFSKERINQEYYDLLPFAKSTNKKIEKSFHSSNYVPMEFRIRRFLYPKLRRLKFLYDWLQLAVLNREKKHGR